MRLLSVTKSTGGLARYNRRLCRLLLAAGQRVDVVCLSDGAQAYAEEMGDLGLDATPMSMARYKIDPLGDLRLACGLVDRLRRGRYDAVLGHGSKAGFLVRLAGRVTSTRSIYRLASMSFVERIQGRGAGLYRQFERLGARLGGHVVTVADSVRLELLRRRITRADQVSTIHTGVDPADLGPMIDRYAACDALGLDPARPVVGWGARLVPQKDPCDFLEAAARVVRRVPDVQFLMAGDGPLAGQVDETIDRLGLARHVRRVGWQRDVARMLSALDVYVLSSRWEGLPQSLLEAMATGRACVATAVDGSSEAIRDGVDGFLVPAGQHAAMAGRIVTLLEDPRRRIDLGRAAADRARQRFHVDRMIEQWSNLFERIVSSPLGAPRG